MRQLLAYSYLMEPIFANLQRSPLGCQSHSNWELLAQAATRWGTECEALQAQMLPQIAAPFRSRHAIPAVSLGFPADGRLCCIELHHHR